MDLIIQIRHPKKVDTSTPARPLIPSCVQDKVIGEGIKPSSTPNLGTDG
jgi:hypothetical protein